MVGEHRSTARVARRPVTAAEYRTLARFRRGLRAFLFLSEQAARSVGLTPAQHQLLLAIKGAKRYQPPTIRDIADSLKLQHHSVVELVDRAAAAGLLDRRADPNDARCQRLVLTLLGETKLAALSGLHRDELRRFRRQMLEDLSPLG